MNLFCAVFFSFKYHFSFSYSFGDIFILVLTFLHVSVVRLMTTVSKPVKVKNAVTATYLLLFYYIKKQVQFTVHWVHCRNTCLYRDTLVLFVFLMSHHHTARIIVQHRLDRQETPQDPVTADTVSCRWTRDPTRTVWHSVPEMELCPGALPCNVKQQQHGIQIRTQALPLWALYH